MKKLATTFTVCLFVLVLFSCSSPTKRPFDEWTKEDYQNSTIYNGSCTDTITFINHKGDTITKLYYMK